MTTRYRRDGTSTGAPEPGTAEVPRQRTRRRPVVADRATGRTVEPPEAGAPPGGAAAPAGSTAPEQPVEPAAPASAAVAAPLPSPRQPLKPEPSAARLIGLAALTVLALGAILGTTLGLVLSQLPIFQRDATPFGLTTGGIPLGESRWRTLPVAGVVLSDPAGAAGEGAAPPELAIDADAATRWTLGRLPGPDPQGAGLLLDLGEVRTVARIDVATPWPGARLALAVGTDPDRTVSATRLSSTTTTDGTSRLTPQEAARGRYVLVEVVTAAPAPDDAQGRSFRAGISEIAVMGQ